MTSVFKSSQIVTKNYLKFSFYSSILFLLVTTYQVENILDETPFRLFLVLINFYFYRSFSGVSWLVKTKEWSFFLLAQSLCVAGMGAELAASLPVFLCIIPSIVGLVLSVNHRSQKKAIALIPISLCFYWGLSYGVFEDVSAHEFLSSWQLEFAVFSTFICWGVGTLYFSSEGENEYKSVLEFPEDYEEQKDRFFFHDLVNQIHGIYLFNSRKLNLGRGLTDDECRSLDKELEVIKSMIHDHYRMEHKDLYSLTQVVPFFEIKDEVYHLINNFLPLHKVKCDIHFWGGLGSEEAKECQVNYPIFFRVLTNLIKNIAEKKSTQVILNFGFDENGLHLDFRNKIYSLSDKKNLAKKLENIILNKPTSEEKNNSELLDENQHFMGGGLGSVDYLVKLANGEFSYKVEDGFWVSKVVLPVINKGHDKAA